MVAVIYRDRVEYAVVGDTGPREIIGEASYATAKALGIRPGRHGGGDEFRGHLHRLQELPGVAHRGSRGSRDSG